MDKTASTETVWDLTPPNMPLQMQWPALERTPELSPKEKKKKSGWKKTRKNRRQANAEPAQRRRNELDQSLIASPEEQEKLMQLMTLFDQLEVPAIVSVLRGAHGRMEDAIDQLLVLNDEMEKQAKSGESKEDQNPEDPEEVSDSFLSKKERMERDLFFGDSDLEVDDFEDLVEDDQENEQEEDEPYSLSSSVTEGNSVRSSITEKYTVLGEDIELPAVPVQDSEVERWLKEFDSTRSIPRNASSDSLDSHLSLDSSKPLSDSQTTMDSSFPLLGDSGPLTDSIPELVDTTHLTDSLPSLVGQPYSGLLESQENHLAQFLAEKSSQLARSLSLEIPPKEDDKPYFFALEDRSAPTRPELSPKRLERHSSFMHRMKENKLFRQRTKLSRRLSLPKDVGTLTMSPPVVSIGVDPKEQVETVTLEFHKEKVAELEAANKRIDAEKRKAMAWCVEQMMQLKKETEDKDAKIEEHLKQIESQKAEIEALNQKLQEMQTHENKLQTLLISSKDMIVEGVQSLQKNIGEVTSGDWVVLGKVKELDIVEKMSEFASTLKNEISSAFSNIEAKVQSAVAPADEGLSHEEERQIWLAEKGSLESYVEELKKRINELEVKEPKHPDKEEKETQVQVQTASKESSTTSSAVSQESQTPANRFENHYSDSHQYFAQQYRQQWESLNQQYFSK